MVFSNWSFVALVVGVFCMGYVFNNLIRRILDHYSDKNYKKKINDIFQGILNNIYSNKTKFSSRINNTVSVITELENIGTINIIYLMDKKDIAIFKDDRCIYTSDSAEKELVDEIITGVEIFYKAQINDVVNVLGMIFSREEFENKFGIKVDDIKNNMYAPKAEISDIDKIKENNEKLFNIDDILDKISSVGIESLTVEEKEFLDRYNE